MKNLDPTELKRQHRQWRRRTTQRIDLVLDTVQNPYNLGSIIRTAAAFGVEHLHLVGSVEPTHAKVAKTALGTLRYLPWTGYGTIAEAFEQVRRSGLTVVGVELAEGAAPLFDIGLGADTALVVGHEDRGLSKDALARCDAVGYVPQTGKVGSLNVAMAASVAVYEARRQAWSVSD